MRSFILAATLVATATLSSNYSNANPAHDLRGGPPVASVLYWGNVPPLRAEADTARRSMIMQARTPSTPHTLIGVEETTPARVR
jgi:hypothetical protein